MSGPTPTLSEVIRNAIESRLYQLHTMMPGTVTAVDIAKGSCDVQPSLMRVDPNGDPVKLPVIPNCPIGFYRSGIAAVYLPIAIGDAVEIRFCERSLDQWLQTGGTVDPADKRKHHLSDAVVYPGMYDFTDPPSDADPANLVVVNGDSKITLSPAGKLTIAGVSDDLLQIVKDLITKLMAVKTPTMQGPQGFLPTDITDLQAIQTRIAGIMP